MFTKTFGIIYSKTKKKENKEKKKRKKNMKCLKKKVLKLHASDKKVGQAYHSKPSRRYKPVIMYSIPPLKPDGNQSVILGNAKYCHTCIFFIFFSSSKNYCTLSTLYKCF